MPSSDGVTLCKKTSNHTKVILFLPHLCPSPRNIYSKGPQDNKIKNKNKVNITWKSTMKFVTLNFPHHGRKHKARMSSKNFTTSKEV